MFKCPYCEKRTISIVEKMFEVYSDCNKCTNCRGEWTMSGTKYFWLASFFIVLATDLFKYSSFLSLILAPLLYILGIAFFTSIKKVHE